MLETWLTESPKCGRPPIAKFQQCFFFGAILGSCFSYCCCSVIFNFVQRSSSEDADPATWLVSGKLCGLTNSDHRARARTRSRKRHVTESAALSSEIEQLPDLAGI